MGLKYTFRHLFYAKKIQKERLYKTLEDLDARITALEDGETPTIYYFTSYDDAEKTTEYATGTARTTGVTSGDYSQIKVLTNSVEGFVGNKYYIPTDAKTDGTVYELFTDAGTTSAEIFVTISTTAP